MFAITIVLIVQAFKVRDMLRDHFNYYLGHDIYWSGILTFFLWIYYLQYRINRLDYDPAEKDTA